MRAYAGFGDKEEDDKLWQDEITPMALAHPFLMRGILAVSALHLGRTRPEEKPHYLAIEAYHQNLALPPYRYLVENPEHRMDKGNAPAITAFGRLTIAYAFSSPHSPGSILFAGLCSSTGVPEWLSVFTFVESVPQRYPELLSVLRPVALVILCYMCVLLQECGDCWYINGAAERIVSEVDNKILGEEWWSWIAWPLQRVPNGREISSRQLFDWCLVSG
jgi:hypothetical protein